MDKIGMIISTIQTEYNSIRVVIIVFIVVHLVSCSTKSIVSTVSELPNLNGVWVDSIISITERVNLFTDPDFKIIDTTYYVSVIDFDSGSFTLTVPDFYTGYMNLVPLNTSYYDFPEKTYQGRYEISNDSLYLIYLFDSTEYTEQFRFLLSSDSLALYFNNDGEIDTTTNNRDTLVIGGQIRNFLVSVLWPCPFNLTRMSGVFRRVE